MSLCAFTPVASQSVHLKILNQDSPERAILNAHHGNTKELNRGHLSPELRSGHLENKLQSSDLDSFLPGGLGGCALISQSKREL